MTDVFVTLHRVDQQDQVFVMEGTGGTLFRCSFQEALRDTVELATILGEDIEPFEPGDPAVLHEQTRLVKIIQDEDLKLATWYGSAASPALRAVLEKVRREETLVRLWFGEIEKAPHSVWLVDDSSTIIGRVTRTDGPLKQPVLGGKLINSRYLLAVSRWESGHDEPVFLWQHEHFRRPDLRLLETPDGIDIQATTSTGEVVTLLRNFQDLELATKWVRHHTGMKPTNIKI